MSENTNSVLRNLFKDAFNCCYEEGDIKISVDFNANNKILFSYNDLPGSTEIGLTVSTEQYGAIKENLLTITDKKGIYINLVELCFAFNMKKLMNKQASKEYLKRTLEIAVLESGEIATAYKMAYFKKSGNMFIRFWQSGKSIVDFICHETDGFVFLVPFAVAAVKRQSISKVFLPKYNFFSTYELTGDELPRKIKYEKLSAFFISIPADFVGTDGNAVINKVEQGVKDLIKSYSQYFVLDIYDLPNIQYRYGLRPRSYGFGFIRNFVTTSRLTQSLSEFFLENINIQFPGEETPVTYARLKETAFSHERSDVPEAEHHSGRAYRTHILGKREDMIKQLSGHSDKTMYLSYDWDSGREFYYEFIRPSGVYIIESKVKPGLPDYGLYALFQSFAERQLFRYFTKGSYVEDETALEAVFAYFDDVFKREYTVNMRFYQLYVSRGEENDVVNISKISVYNLKKAIDTLEKRRDRFDSQFSYDETVKMLVQVFSQGKELLDCLTKLKNQDVKVTLATDAGGKIRFSVYGSLFLIPPRTTASQMLKVVGDIGAILDLKMWEGRDFDYPITKSRYFFNPNNIYTILKGECAKYELKDAVSVVGRFFVSDMKMEKIALLNKTNKVIEIIDIGSPIDALAEQLHTGKDLKIVLLRDDCTKPETADILEWLICGVNNSLVSETLSKNVIPNIVLPDQIPYYNRPLPQIKLEEFEYLRGEIKRLNGYHGKREIVKQVAYRNYFAKDVNHKLFGYGGCCPLCGIELDSINGFAIREFTLEIISAVTGMETDFKFALYMCANDFCAADGWVFEDISIGGMNPFMWLKEVVAADRIAPEFLRCTIHMTTQVTGVVPADDYAVSRRKTRKSFETPKTAFEFPLSPLLAAKWVEDNLTE
jgi:hypothetical protein